MKKPIPWRIQSDIDGTLDELVLGNGKVGGGGTFVLHIEHTGDNGYFIDVVGHCFWVHIEKGEAVISMREDRTPEAEKKRKFVAAAKKRGPAGSRRKT